MIGDMGRGVNAQVTKRLEAEIVATDRNSRFRGTRKTVGTPVGTRTLIRTFSRGHTRKTPVV